MLGFSKIVLCAALVALSQLFPAGILTNAEPLSPSQKFASLVDEAALQELELGPDSAPPGWKSAMKLCQPVLAMRGKVLRSLQAKAKKRGKVVQPTKHNDGKSKRGVSLNQDSRAKAVLIDTEWNMRMCCYHAWTQVPFGKAGSKSTPIPVNQMECERKSKKQGCAAAEAFLERATPCMDFTQNLALRTLAHISTHPPSKQKPSGSATDARKDTYIPSLEADVMEDIDHQESPQVERMAEMIGATIEEVGNDPEQLAHADEMADKIIHNLDDELQPDLPLVLDNLVEALDTITDGRYKPDAYTPHVRETARSETAATLNDMEGRNFSPNLCVITAGAGAGGGNAGVGREPGGYGSDSDDRQEDDNQPDAYTPHYSPNDRKDPGGRSGNRKDGVGGLAAALVFTGGTYALYAGGTAAAAIVGPGVVVGAVGVTASAGLYRLFCS